MAAGLELVEPTPTTTPSGVSSVLPIASLFVLVGSSFSHYYYVLLDCCFSFVVGLVLFKFVVVVVVVVVDLISFFEMKFSIFYERSCGAAARSRRE